MTIHMQELKVNEIFTSIQGEGPWIGRMCTFIRTQGCNLRCSFCDTQRAQDDSNSSLSFSSPDSLMDYLPLYPSNIIWTGGEPSLRIDFIEDVISSMGCGYNHAMETNGSILFDTSLFDVVVISPKHPDYVEQWVDSKNVVFKFVVDSTTIGETIELCKQYDIQRAYLMPLGKSQDEIVIVSNDIIDYLKHPSYTDFILSPRLHILLGVQ